MHFYYVALLVRMSYDIQPERDSRYRNTAAIIEMLPSELRNNSYLSNSHWNITIHFHACMIDFSQELLSRFTVIVRTMAQHPFNHILRQVFNYLCAPSRFTVFA